MIILLLSSEKNGLAYPYSRCEQRKGSIDNVGVDNYIPEIYSPKHKSKACIKKVNKANETCKPYCKIISCSFSQSNSQIKETHMF